MRQTHPAGEKVFMDFAGLNSSTRAVFAENILRVPTCEKLIQNLFLDSHMMLLRFISMASNTRFLTVPVEEPAMAQPRQNQRSTISTAPSTLLLSRGLRLRVGKIVVS
jgi:hypothetical protein